MAIIIKIICLLPMADTGGATAGMGFVSVSAYFTRKKNPKCAWGKSSTREKKSVKKKTVFPNQSFVTSVVFGLSLCGFLH